MRFFTALLTSLVFSVNAIYAQSVTQNIIGRVTDKDSKMPLIGVTVFIPSDSGQVAIGAMTDPDGFFKLTGVPLGGKSVKATFIGYKPVSFDNIMVNSGKETILNIEMEEISTELNEVVITATDKTGTVNDMVSVSTRTFDKDETERYAGSRQDPTRMASNFAGVQGTNDSRNDIVVRGNSPQGLLWRFEDVDIPNPNHFSVAGSTGGPVTILNNKYIGTSDFMTGAFPAQYGNGTAGVFDLKMRNGNTEKHEVTGQFGFLGTELSAEGPLNKKTRASYLATFRYSTLALFGAMKISIGTSAVPQYWDGAYRFNLPTKKFGVFTLWGLGGNSTIDLVLSKFKTRTPELYGDNNRDQYFKTFMHTHGLAHTYAFNNSMFIKTTLNFSQQGIDLNHNFIFRQRNFAPYDPLVPILGGYAREYRTTLTSYINKKIDARNSFRLGFFVTRYDQNLLDTVRSVVAGDSLPNQLAVKPWKNRQDFKGNFYLYQAYFQWKWRATEKITINPGIHMQYLDLNGSFALEPRLGVRWDFLPKHTLSFGYGLHSQMQATYLYFTKTDSVITNGVKSKNVNNELTNKGMGFTRNHHFVLGYDYVIRKDMRIRLETYYQHLFNIPVYETPSSVSLVNQGGTFSRFFPIYNMVNTGIGRNYGVELTVEKFFSNNYFLLFSGSLFQSEYQGSNGKWRNTDFNGNFATNLVGGYEIKFDKVEKHSLTLSGKITYAGGRRYSPADSARSAQNYDLVPVDDKVNTQQFPNYFRLDLRLAYKYNAKKVTHEITFDLINVLGTQNLLAYTYSPDPTNPSASPLVPTYQLGRLPLFYYKIDF